MDLNLKAKIQKHFIQNTDFLQVKDRLTEEQMRVYVDRAITELCHKEDIPITTEDRITLIREFVAAAAALGPIRPLMEDETISEIMINGYKKIYIQRRGKIQLTDITFDSNSHLLHTVQKLVVASGSNKRVDESSPYVDFSMPDGSRVNVIISPCSLIGPVITIRKFSKDITTVDHLLNLGMMDKKMAVLLIAAMRAKLNVVFCGSTGTGKTTALNVLSRHLPEDERIITIEDTPELRLIQEHVVTLQSKPMNIEGRGIITIGDLFINSLRMRPDRLIIGEIRGAEILDLIQSISSGHSGSLAIVHADSPEDCFDRMVTMMLMSGIRLSTAQIQRMVAKAIDLIVHIELWMDGTRRINQVTDLYFDEKNKKVVIEDIFHFQQDSIKEDGQIVGHWEMNKRKPSSYPKFLKRHVELPAGFFE